MSKSLIGNFSGRDSSAQSAESAPLSGIALTLQLIDSRLEQLSANIPALAEQLRPILRDDGTGEAGSKAGPIGNSELACRLHGYADALDSLNSLVLSIANRVDLA